MLIGIEKTDDAFRCYPVSGPTDQVSGDVVDAQPHWRACVCNHRQDFVVIVGQIMANLGNVRTDQLSVVQQPLGCMGDSVIQTCGFVKISTRPLDCSFALPQDRQQRLRSRGCI
jgi:hypothetical protein